MEHLVEKLDEGRHEFIKTRQRADRETKRERERERERTVESRLGLEDKGSMETSNGYASRH